MRRERPRERAASHRLHHRRLHFEEAPAIEKPPNGRHDPRAGFEHLTRVGIDDQIEIPLAIPGLDVAEPVPFLGQRAEALRQEVNPGRPDGQFVRLRPEQPPFHADDVTQVESLIQLEIQVRNRIRPHVHLHAIEPVGQHEEVGLAERAQAENAAGRAHLHAIGVEDVAGLAAVLGLDGGDRGGAIEPGGIGRDAHPHEFVEFGLALRDLFGFVGHAFVPYRAFHNPRRAGLQPRPARRA